MKHHLKTTTTKYIIFNVLTFGVYFYFIQNKINATIKYLGLAKDFHKVRRASSNCLMYTVIGLILLFTPYKITVFLSLVSLLYAYINSRVWGFHVRKCISEYAKSKLGVDYKPNALLTFLFPGFYLTWAINYLDDKL